MTSFISVASHFNNKNLKKIVNVYQLQYKNGVAQGLGDYIRGSFCLLQISNILGLQFEMNLFNHPISKYLLPVTREMETINYSEISKYENTNYIPTTVKTFKKNSIRFFIDFIAKLNSLDRKEDTFYLFCNSFPLFDDIKPLGKQIIRSYLTPNTLMKEYIKEKLFNLQLKPKEFTVIHIRTGDRYLLKNNNLNPNIVKKIISILQKNMKQNIKYLLISDNNDIKLLLKNVIPSLITQISKITHFGESTNQTDDSIKETLLDFYIMSFSFQVISFSPYNWGSGFSEWSSKLNNIPFSKIQILDKLS